MKLKKIVSILLSAVLLLAAAMPVYAVDACDVHTDKNYDMICDVCAMNPYAGAPGVNMSVMIVNDYLYLLTYLTGVDSVTAIDAPVIYDENVLLPLDGSYNEYLHFDLVYFEPVDGLLNASFGASHPATINSDDPVLLYVYYFAIIDSEANIIDSLHVGNYDVEYVDMLDGSECTFNPIFFMDSTHEHFDYDNDWYCDICDFSIVPYHDCVDANYDTVCDLYGDPVYYWGDMNCDGNITASDARIALRIAAQLEEVTEYYLFVGDFNEDGRITASEARRILRVAARIDTFEDL